MKLCEFCCTTPSKYSHAHAEPVLYYFIVNYKKVYIFIYTFFSLKNWKISPAKWAVGFDPELTSKLINPEMSLKVIINTFKHMSDILGPITNHDCTFFLLFNWTFRTDDSTDRPVCLFKSVNN